ncbi:Hypothetical protein NCS54_01223200 [Fusarium falciforme]|uniref:Hypothetical protein n=1 Tax=Fusarium falciforme TaxID=195108 RepID=UPI0023016D9E|nr:Hypothetical protein NCS54_01223200 [Fusarium falciforme]WAO94640.1 Hypothetical protein NCS54_01223200 [Fusarium falciforme]
MLLRRFAKTIAIVDILAAKVNSLTPQTLTSFNNLDYARLRSEEPEQGLRRRQYDDYLTTGTITVTVAPDEICGFDDWSSAYHCPPSTACSWELDSIANVFCGFEDILTTCLDRIDAIDTDICDDDCYWDDYILKCTKFSSPYCVELYFGDITAWGCSDSRTSETIYSTDDGVPREFTTIVFVDGTPSMVWVDTPIAESPINDPIETFETTTTEEPIETEPAPPPPPHPGLNVGAVVGGVVGGLAVISLTILGILYILRRNRRRDQSHGSLPESTAHSSVPDTKVVGSPTITQPYTPRTMSPIQPQNDATLPQTAYFNHDAVEAATSDHLSASTHEFGGLVGDRQYASMPGT